MGRIPEDLFMADFGGISVVAGSKEPCQIELVQVEARVAEARREVVALVVRSLRKVEHFSRDQHVPPDPCKGEEWISVQVRALGFHVSPVEAGRVVSVDQDTLLGTSDGSHGDVEASGIPVELGAGASVAEEEVLEGCVTAAFVQPVPRQVLPDDGERLASVAEGLDTPLRQGKLPLVHVPGAVAHTPSLVNKLPHCGDVADGASHIVVLTHQRHLFVANVLEDLGQPQWALWA
mmetsp:Transcript_22697/g.66088  ORF Transcript_22697/g.66088 Transcript_22697/m.66088 type:complete len:234 (+) Transcript_22697:304-1005(+)